MWIDEMFMINVWEIGRHGVVYIIGVLNNK